ncbi:MAG TPA: alpha/beta hydrolase [Mycobacteriales bacterium]|jgi:pimeloyl-ACP methyl ester carboxylesterase|nr:alpha/beta hydrolase [Mycobacteriales bacterium]
MVRVGSGRTTTRLHVERDGAGEPLLWITGFAISSEIFTPVMTRYTAGYDCIRYDNRGSGRSESRWRVTSVPELAGDAVRLLDALGLDSAHVYGLSMGGMIAQEMAIRFPDRVRGLVLGATTHGGPRAALPDPRVAAALTSRSAPKALRAELVSRALFTEAYRAREPDLVREHLLLLAAHPARVQGVLSHLLASTYHDTRARLAQVQAPTLVLHGADDRLTPVANARRIAALVPDAELVVLPEVGHGYLLEAPDASYRAFATWLEARSPVPAGRPLHGLAAAAEPLTRAFGLPVGALRTGASLLSPRQPPTP